MIQLYIENKPAVIKSGSSFKFYRENIYFTEAEDYTLDVTLPLQGCPENLAIFSAIHRPEMSAVPLIGKKYPFHFIAPPLDISGSAIVTEINELEVKVQLLAGANIIDDTSTLGNGIYIDELDLGKAFDVSYTGTQYDGNGKGALSFTLDKKPTLFHSVYDESIDKCVCFPVYSEGSDVVVNSHYYWGYQYSNKHYGIRPYFFEKFSAQPYLLLIVERVLNAIGYELDENNAIAKSWQRNIFIVNGRNEYRYNKILPHWTVSEFLKEVGLLCGVHFTVQGNKVNAIRKKQHYEDEEDVVHITDVIDEYSAEIYDEADSNEYQKTNNVGYDFEDIDPMLQLPDEVWENANVIESFSDENSMRQYAGSYDSSKSNWLLSERKNHGVYAFMRDTDDSWLLCEVDQAGSLIREGNNGRNIDVSLRIVPAKMIMKPVHYGYYWKTGQMDMTIKNAFYVPMLMISGTIDSKPSTYSINDAINPNSDSNDDGSNVSVERIEVALFDNGVRSLGNYSFTKDKEDYSATTEVVTDSISIPLATGIPYTREDGVYFTELFTDKLTHKSLLFKEGTQMYETFNYGDRIDTRCKHIYQFLDNIDPNPKNIFNIRGRKYACQKIEYTVEEQGLSPIKRGYFYEIND